MEWGVVRLVKCPQQHLQFILMQGGDPGQQGFSLGSQADFHHAAVGAAGAVLDQALQPTTVDQGATRADSNVLPFISNLDMKVLVLDALTR